MNDSFSLYVLLSHPGISPDVAHQLIQLFESAEAVLCESKNTIKPSNGVRNSLGKKLKHNSFLNSTITKKSYSNISIQHLHTLTWLP